MPKVSAGAKAKVVVSIIAVLAIAALLIEIPRLTARWEINSALKEGAAANRKFVSVARTRAESGDAQAQFNLAVLYEQGLRDALPKDQGQALAWYDKAATQGHPEARRVLDGYVKSGMISAPDFHGKWSPVPRSDARKRTPAQPLKTSLTP
jgi:TPR repeat protein